MKRVITLLVALAVLTVPATALSTGELISINEDHGLNSNASIENYETDGVATTTLQSPHITMTMSEDADTVDAPASLTHDMQYSYLRVNYHSEKPITIQLHLDEEYIHPYTRNEVEGLNGNTTASIEKASNGMVSITMSLEEEDTAIIPLDHVAATQFSLLDHSVERADKADPTSDNSTDWVYPDADSLDGQNASYSIDTKNPDETVVEYAVVEDNETKWRSVPSNQDNPAPLFRYQKDDVQNTVIVVSEVNETPPIRYKTNPSSLDSLGGAVDDALRIVDSLIEDMGELF